MFAETEVQCCSMLVCLQVEHACVLLVCLQVGLLGFTTVLGPHDCAPLPSPRCAALVIWLVAHMARCASVHVDVALP